MHPRHPSSHPFRVLLQTPTLFLVLALTTPTVLRAADPVFSGPQPGETATPFTVLAVTGDSAGSEREIQPGTPTALVFVHAIERSIVPLLRAVDAYGALRADRLRTEVIFLTADRLEGEQRLRAAAASLRLAAHVGLSTDGPEGPGNYGLNKECMMTIVAARDGRVTANFALIQPGITDAPRIIAALAAVCGDDAPPSIEQLTGPAPDRGSAPMRESPDRPGSGEPFPGAVPTDPTLVSLLRRFIQPTNDNATVDAVLADVRAHVRTHPDLRHQAIDGWTRILHFGDRYGTGYARTVGTAFLAELRADTP